MRVDFALDAGVGPNHRLMRCRCGFQSPGRSAKQKKKRDESVNPWCRAQGLVPRFNRIEGKNKEGARADLPKPRGSFDARARSGVSKTLRFDRREVLARNLSSVSLSNEPAPAGGQTSGTGPDQHAADCDTNLLTSTTRDLMQLGIICRIIGEFFQHPEADERSSEDR
jgi:hypothetical protein